MDDDKLSRVLREWQVPDAPAELEIRLLSAVHSEPRPKGAVPRIAAMAALLLLGVWLARVQPARAPARPASLLSLEGGDAPFVPVPFVPPLDSYETGAVLRVRLPLAALIKYGYRVPLADPAAVVIADVIVGDDGRTHAVRLVSTNSSEDGGE